MTSAANVLAVLRWACGGGLGPIPQADLREAESLRRPSLELRSALAELAVVTAARLRLGAHPLGDSTPITCDTLILAAAIGVSSTPRLSRVLLAELTVAHNGAEWSVRHGLVEPALARLAPDMADDLRILSPLTAVFDRPSPGGTTDAVATARQLRANAAGRRALALMLAEPTTSVTVREWRTELMSRWRAGDEADQDFVLDVYELAMVYHEESFLAQAREAQTVLADPVGSRSDEQAREALSIANWWEPLSRIDRANVGKLRDRHYLGYNYRDGLKLYRFSRQLTGELA